MNKKQIIKQNFSRFAGFYDKYSHIQDLSAQKLLTFLPNSDCKNILDIGCGTGNYTKLLNEKFPNANITAVDISEKMIKIARQKLNSNKIVFITADAESITFNEKFDLVTSNACFQWFENLSNALKDFTNLLKENGTILFSIFGPKTFYQLRQSLNQLYKKEHPLTSDFFYNQQQLIELLSKHFDNVFVQQQLIDYTYSSLLNLLNTIKYTGTKGLGLNGKTLNKTKLARLENIYKQNFSEIDTAYQIFYCSAKKGD